MDLVWDSQRRRRTHDERDYLVHTGILLQSQKYIITLLCFFDEVRSGGDGGVSVFHMAGANTTAWGVRWRVSHVRVYELIFVALCTRVYVGHGNEMSPEMRSR